MSYETAIIPPVQAGEIYSDLSIDYDHDKYGEGGFEADGHHAWTFDAMDYHAHTGMDVGDEHSYVAQANGHDIRLNYSFRWANRDERFTLSMEIKAVSGYDNNVLWVQQGYYDLNEQYKVVSSNNEKPRRYLRDERQLDVPVLDGQYITTGERFVRGLFGGQYGTRIETQLQDAIAMDSPHDAVMYHEYDTDSNDSTALTAD